MDATQRAVLVLGCQEAVVRFFAALDAGRMADVANAMAEDGVWHRQGAALRGPDAVLRALAARPAGRTTAHLVQNLTVDLDDEDNARVGYLLLTYRHDSPEGSTGAAPLDHAFSIASYDDQLQRSGDRWLVRERCSRTLFSRQG